MRKSFPALVLIIITILLPILLTAQNFGGTPLKQCWNLETATLKTSNPASDNVILFIPLPDGVIRAVGIKTNETVWQTEIGGEISGPLIVVQGSIFVAAFSKLTDNQSDGQKMIVSSISAATGVTQWRKELNAESTDLYLSDSTAGLCITTGNGQIYLLDKTDGSTISEKSLNLKIEFPPVIKENEIFLGEKTGKILSLALDGTDRETKEIFKLKNIPTAMIYAEENLYVGDQLGKVYRINARDKKSAWTFRTGAEIRDITEVGDDLLISSADNYVYFISKKKGSQVWKKRLQGKSQGKSLVSGETAVFAPFGEKTAVFVELKRGKTINQIALAANNDNFFINNPSLSKDIIVFSTLEGFYAFAAGGCS